ncbi:MAG: DUF192 domain-containing protein [Nitrosomonadales bacterium]|nr:DUF192 domain-containing protein [Nitrosomonadales bacterium]
MTSLRHIALLLCLMLAPLSSWGAGDGKPPAEYAQTELSIAGHPAHAEIADTPQKQEHGLMQRTQLCPDCGMLFVFSKADRYDFWMKDTPLPLSIAFIAADGSIINIEEMQPNTTDDHYAQGDALYALEMNKGWFAGNGIKAGDKVHDLPHHQ